MIVEIATPRSSRRPSRRGPGDHRRLASGTHDETLIVHVGAGGARPRHYPEEFRRGGHLRLSVGLEAPRDLVADPEQALTLTLGPR